MNNSKKLDNKFCSIVWGFILLAPILLCVIGFIFYIKDYEFITDKGTWSIILTDVIQVINGHLESFTFNGLNTALDKLFSVFGFGSSVLVDFMKYYFSYLVFVFIFKITFDLIVLLPRICQKFINKVGD